MFYVNLALVKKKKKTASVKAALMHLRLGRCWLMSEGRRAYFYFYSLHSYRHLLFYYFLFKKIRGFVESAKRLSMGRTFVLDLSSNAQKCSSVFIYSALGDGLKENTETQTADKYLQDHFWTFGGPNWHLTHDPHTPIILFYISFFVVVVAYLHWPSNVNYLI